MTVRIALIWSSLLLLAAQSAFAAKPSRSDFFIRDGDRVVFYGDSITDNEWYPTLVESFVLTRYPGWRNRFTNRGVSGDNSGSIARFERDVIAQRPDVVTYNMGFNDGGYWGLRSEQLEKWLANIEQSVALARAENPKVRLALASPIPNEPSVSADPRWVSREVYPYTMLAFGGEEERLARRLGVPFVDLGMLYGQSMGLGKVAAGATFQLSRDGVHPQREGQTLIAFHLLRGLGATPLVAAVNIDAAKAKVTDAQRCTVKEVTVRDGSVSFRRLCEALPYPTPAEARPFAFLVRLDDRLNADLLTVRGLTALAYTLYVDDQKIAVVAAAELAEGLNLSRYPTTPFYVQALAVMDAVRKKQVAETAYWRQYIFAGKADGTGLPTTKASPEERTAMRAARAAIADAEAACYALNSPQPHTIRLEPSTGKVARYDALVAAEIQQAPLTLSVMPLEADWNRLTLLGNEVTVTLTNPAAVARTGTLSWACAEGWRVTPAEIPFTVEAGKRLVVKCAVSAPTGATLMPTPTVTARWRWSADWPYPMTLTRPLELTPRLTINHATRTPRLTGQVDEWADATTITLEKSCYIDPAVPGKKLLWDGPADLSGQFFLKWDDTALYLAALVRDSEHLQEASEMMMWSQDVFMPAFLMPEAGKSDGRYEFGFGAQPGHDVIARYWNAAKDAVGPEIRFASRRIPDQGSTFYEVVLPWNRLAPFTPAAGKGFRCTLAVSDADLQPGKGFNYLAWTPGVHYGKNPADFARITLGAP
jgi:lysophospholipase L1-like esterase